MCRIQKTENVQEVAQDTRIEFPILMEESNEVTLFINSEEAEKTNNGNNKHVFIFF